MRKLSLRHIFIVLVTLGLLTGFGCSSSDKTADSSDSNPYAVDGESDSYESDAYSTPDDSDPLETYTDVYGEEETDTASTDDYSSDDTYGDSYSSTSSDSDEMTSSELVGEEEVATNLPEKTGEDTYSSDSSYDTSGSSDYGSSTSSYDDTGATAGETVYYTVEKGDTLMEIAFAHYGNYSMWQKVFQDNNYKVSSPELLQIGTVLTLENVPGISITKNGDPYVIQSGDTLLGISQKLYGTTAYWSSLQQNNPELILDANRIFAGMTIYYDPTNALTDRMPTTAAEPAEEASYSSESESATYDDSGSYDESESSSEEYDYSDF